MISHDRTADQSHEYLGCNDFFGQGSIYIYNYFVCRDLALCYSRSYSPTQLLTFMNASMLTLFGVFVDAPAAMSTPHVSLWRHSDARRERFNAYPW